MHNKKLILFAVGESLDGTTSLKRTLLIFNKKRITEKYNVGF